MAISSEALTGMNDNGGTVSSHKNGSVLCGFTELSIVQMLHFSKPSPSRQVLAP